MPCPSCARELSAEARFCPYCGTPAAAARAAEQRKVVTVVFCDLAGSTELSGLLDPELLRAILLRYFAVMRERVEAHGGAVEKYIGDAVMAVFGLVTREDDARRALAAALAMAEALHGLNLDFERDHGLRLSVRIGVHTGEVVTTATPAERQTLVSGDVVNIAARLQSAAAPGQILVSEATRRAAGSALRVAPVGRLTLRGVSEPVEAARLLAVHAAREGLRRSDTPFVGRERDLTALDLAWDRVVSQGEAHVLTLLGEAGIGKTRLLAQWLGRLEPDIAATGVGCCRSLGAGGSLTALADCVEPLVAGLESGPGPDGGAAPPDPAVGAAVAVLRRGLLLDGAPSPSRDETSTALACVLEAVAARRPALLAIDDCHWADPLLVEVVDRLLDELEHQPVLLICLARPEFTDLYPTWAAGRANAGTITLRGLSPQESAQLAAELVDVSAHAMGAAEHIVGQAAGNPLYLEQLGAAAAEHSADPDQLPPTLRALLAARIDGLDAAARTALQHAAVVGPEFDLEDLGCLVAPGEAAELGSGMRTLIRRRFVAPRRRGGAQRASYEFANPVALRVAYEGLTKRTRSDLHERFARCLIRRRCSDVLIGEHYERAFRFHAEVNVIDARGAALRTHAAGYLARAGSAALRRVDPPRAEALLSRAVELTDPADPRRAGYLQQLGEARLTLGRAEEAEQALRSAVAEAAEHGQPVVAAHAELFLSRLRAAPAEERAARGALPIFTANGDDLGLARTRLILARCCQKRGRHAEALGILEGALGHAVAAQANQDLANILGATGRSLWLGPEPAARAVDRCTSLLDEYGQSRPAVRATLGFPLTVLCAIRGDRDAAQRHLAVTQEAMSAISYAEAKVFRPLLTALLALADGEDAAAEAGLSRAHDALDHAPHLNSVVTLEFARVRLDRGGWQEAKALLAQVRVDDDRAGRAGLLGLRARISAHEQQYAAATGLAAQAVAEAEAADSPICLGLAYLDQAHTRAALGLTAAAREAACAAGARFAQKGDLSGVARAEALAGRCR